MLTQRSGLVQQFSDEDIEVLIRYFEHAQAAADLRMARLNEIATERRKRV